MPSGIIRVQIAPHVAPDGVATFQIDKFDPNKLDDLKKKQINGAIDSLKIIHSCLKCYFDGQLHMYKPISAQLRILFCDFQKKKDNSLIYRIHPDIKMLSFKELVYEKISSGHLSHATAPYVIEEFSNGIVSATLDISPPYKYILLNKWRDQIIDLNPRLNLKQIIRSVADKDGGSHLDNEDSSILKSMRKNNPTKVGSNILFIIALAQYVLDFANQIVPLWIINDEIKV